MSASESNETVEAQRQMLTFIREFASHRLRQFTNMPDLQSIPIEERDISYDHWISEITLVFPGIKLSFRAHFSSKVARALSQTVLGDKSFDSNITHSFMNEYCNLTAGGMKNLISECFLQAMKQNAKPVRKSEPPRLGLPRRAPSFDAARLPESENPKSMAWAYPFSDERLICVSSLKLDLEALFEVTAMDLKTFADTLATVEDPRERLKKQSQENDFVISV